MSVRRTPAGVALELQWEERALLRQVAGEVRELLAEETDDPSLRRLFPPAYEDPNGSASIAS